MPTIGFQSKADFTHRFNSWAYALRFADLRTTESWCERMMVDKLVTCLINAHGVVSPTVITRIATAPRFVSELEFTGASTLAADLRPHRRRKIRGGDLADERAV